MDAVKHMSPKIINEWVDYVRSLKDENMFVVAEYWNVHSVDALKKYIDATEGKVQLFDAPLHHNFFVASKLGVDYDLRLIFDNTLVQHNPQLAVTLVDNHDTQPLQELESPVEPWFKPIAYSLILLRMQGTPCVFYPALYGANYTDKGNDGNDHEIWLPKVDELDKLLVLRNSVAVGEQADYFDHPNCIGWVRKGDPEVPKSGIAVLISNGTDGFKYMELGREHAGKKMADSLKKIDSVITLDENGGAEFHCPPGSVSVWIFK
jgi:alpha-amylase